MRTAACAWTPTCAAPATGPWSGAPAHAPSPGRSPNLSAAVLAQTTDSGSPASSALPRTPVSVLLPGPACLCVPVDLPVHHPGGGRGQASWFLWGVGGHLSAGDSPQEDTAGSCCLRWGRQSGPRLLLHTKGSRPWEWLGCSDDHCPLSPCLCHPS